MRKTRFVLAMLVLIVSAGSFLFAQDKSQPETKTPPTTLKVQIVISETEGEKKLTNLPYTMFVTADYSGPGSPYSKVRIGSRIPVYTGKDGGMQYIDVGTNIDARANGADNGRFNIVLSIERSWVEGDVLIPSDKVAGHTSESVGVPFKEPIIRGTRTDFTLTMRDGQTMQTTQAADPLSGRLLAISVTMNVVK